MEINPFANMSYHVPKPMFRESFIVSSAFFLNNRVRILALTTILFCNIYVNLSDNGWFNFSKNELLNKTAIIHIYNIV